MKKKQLCMVLACLFCMAILCACGSTKEDIKTTEESPVVESVSPSPTVTPTPSPTPTATPTPAPSASPDPTPSPSPTPTPTPEFGLPVITKSPTDETVQMGSSCYFVAKCGDVLFAEWHFVSPDETEDLSYEEAGQRFPTMDIIGPMYATLQLGHIPESANGWKLYCRFINDVGYVDTEKALLTVIGPNTPSPTPTATLEPTVPPSPSVSPLQTEEPAVTPTPVMTVEPTPQPTAGPVVNEWLMTDELETAVAGSGIEFTPPVKAALPGNNMTLTFYRYRTGTVEACYQDEEQNGLLVRKSNTQSGDELSGDYTSYSSSWDQSVKKITVRCKGDGKTINNAVYSDDYCWAILYNVGREGKGLTSDQLNTLITSMK